MSQQIGDFPDNLKLLCSHHKSIADLCRRMQFNRQQFNKYLSGISTPAARNLRRLADFFGVEEGELFLPHQDFTRTVLARPHVDEIPPGVQAFWRASTSNASATQSKLATYRGYYHLYFRSSAWPKRIIRSLAVIYQFDGSTYIKNVERLVRRNKPHLGRFVTKYQGIVLMMGERLFTLDRSDTGSGGFSLMVFYPNQRRNLALLHGLLLAVTAGSGRQIYSSRVAMIYLGDRPDVKDALRCCGVFATSDPDLDSEVCEAVTNDIDPKSGALLALEI